MAKQESTLSAIELAETAAQQAESAYESALELHMLLQAWSEPESHPAWVFPLSRMAERACNLVDEARTAAFRVRAQLGRSDAS